MTTISQIISAEGRVYRAKRRLRLFEIGDLSGAITALIGLIVFLIVPVLGAFLMIAGFINWIIFASLKTQAEIHIGKMEYEILKMRLEMTENRRGPKVIFALPRLT